MSPDSWNDRVVTVSGRPLLEDVEYQVFTGSCLAVCFHQAVVFFGRNGDRRSVTGAGRHLKAAFKFCESARVQIGNFKRVVADAAKVIRQQDPFVAGAVRRR